MFLSLWSACSSRDVLLIGCLVEKVINHIVLIRTIEFNLKQVKQRPVEVCITWKVIWFLEFYIFLGFKNINRLYGTMAQWLRYWISNLGIPWTRTLNGSKVDSVFHPSKVDKRVPRISGNLVGKSKPASRTASASHEAIEPHSWKEVIKFF